MHIFYNQHLKYINQEYNLNNADKIVFSGSSSGGIGVTLWVDYLRGLLKDPKKLYGIVDSGILLDPENLFKIGATSFGILPFFAPGALLNQAQSSSSAQSSQPGGSLLVDPTAAPADKSGSTTALPAEGETDINSGIPNSIGSNSALPSTSINDFLTLSNSD